MGDAASGRIGGGGPPRPPTMQQRRDAAGGGIGGGLPSVRLMDERARATLRRDATPPPRRAASPAPKRVAFDTQKRRRGQVSERFRERQANINLDALRGGQKPSSSSKPAAKSQSRDVSSAPADTDDFAFLEAGTTDLADDGIAKRAKIKKGAKGGRQRRKRTRKKVKTCVTNLFDLDKSDDQ